MVVKGGNFAFSAGYNPYFRGFEICLMWNKRSYLRSDPVPFGEMVFADEVGIRCFERRGRVFPHIGFYQYHIRWDQV